LLKWRSQPGIVESIYLCDRPGRGSATPGSHPNTATAHGTYGSVYTDSSDASYYTTTLDLNKTVTETAFKLGDVLHYNYAVTNPDATHPLLGP